MNTLNKNIFLFIFLIFAQIGNAQCDDLISQTSITNASVNYLVIPISGATNNDLSDPAQGVCGITINFSHDAVSDLVFQLISPSGQVINLVGDISSGGTNTINTNWAVSFVQCSSTATPDAGIQDVWDNSASWTNLGNYSGSYYPQSGCLEDFDAGVVNGNWILRTEDGAVINNGTLFSFGIQFCDDSGINCLQCAPEAGTLSNNIINVCENDNLNLDFGLSGENTDPNYSYAYIVMENGNLITVTTQSDLSGLAVGQYEVFGVSVLSDNLSLLQNSGLTVDQIISGLGDGSFPICLDITQQPKIVNINEAVSPQILREYICEGEDFMIRGSGSTYNSDGIYPIDVIGVGGECDSNYILYLNVIEIDPVIEPSVPMLSCNSPSLILNAKNSLQESFSKFTWSTTDGQIISDHNLDSIEINAPGTYTVIQEEFGCTKTESITISADNSVPSIAINSPSLSCSNTSVQISVIAPSNISSFEWVGPNNYINSTVLEPAVSFSGTYFLKIIDDAGCEYVNSHVVNQGSDQAIINLFAEEINCENSSVLIETNASKTLTTFLWSGPDGFISTIENPEVSTPGTYYLKAIDVDGCDAYKELVVLGNNQLFDYQLIANKFVCNGGSTSIEAISSIPGSFYNWTGPLNFTSSISNPTVTSTGIYHIEIIANGCVVRDSVEVIRDISGLPQYDISVETIGDCENPLFRLTAIPVVNEYQVSLVRWFKSGVGLVGTGLEATTTGGGDFFLHLLTYSGCGIVNRFTIDPLPGSPEIPTNITTMPITCDNPEGNGAITINDENPAYNYEWTGPNASTFFEASISGLNSGNYTLKITDPISNCVSFTVVRVLPDNLSRLTTINNTNLNCAKSEANIILAVRGAASSIEWSGPDDPSLLINPTNPRNFQVSDTGEYYVTVTGSNGCITLDTVEILYDDLEPIISVIDTSLECASFSAPLPSITNEVGLLYNWSGPNDFESTAPLPIVFNTGDYELTVTGLNGCTTSRTLTIIDNPNTPTSIPSTFGDGTLNCEETSITLQGNASATVESYSWTGPNDYLSNEQNPVISEPGTYVLRVDDAKSCFGIDSVIVDQVIAYPEFTISFNPLSCESSTSQFQANSSDPDATFVWSGPNGYSQSGNNVTASEVGDYILSVTGSNNCVFDSIFTLGTQDITIDTNQIINCLQPQLNIGDLDLALNYTISWSGPNGFTSAEDMPNVVDEGLFSAIISGSNGCMGTAQINVSMDTLPPIANVSALGELRCEITSINLSAEGSSASPENTYTWSSIDGTIISGSQSMISTIDGSGTYELTVIDTLNGCSAIASIVLSETTNNFSTFDFQTSDPICSGESTGLIEIQNTIGGTAPFNYSLDGIIFNSDPIFDNLASGDYNIYVKDSFGCLIVYPANLIEQLAIQLELGDNIDVFLGDPVLISATTNLDMNQIVNINWTVGDQPSCSDCLSFTLNPSTDINIELSIEDMNGCVITDQVKVRVDQEPVVFRPNIFSPNEDGVNDIFFVSANLGVLDINSMKIYDRWGNQVYENFNFEPNDISAGWDGKSNGRPQLESVYLYVMEVEMISGKVKTLRGDVTLIR